ncbi:MAG: DUF262 domain-containing protein, partial [Pyrinomonadaceae bacterium]|nr:DUF262 domain-containing protein [Pyrinomonadaceae bacterium]
DVARDEKLLSHFVGSIVYIQDSVYLSGSSLKLTVIDGQQRLTTISLLLLALAHKTAKIGEREKSENLIEDFIINKRLTNERLKLRPIEEDANALEFLLKNDDLATFNGFSRVIENYRFFENEVSDGEVDLILKGLYKLFFVQVSLERGKDDPQRIFESLNSTGLDLSSADLIRNYVLMDIAPDEQTRIYQTYWREIERYCQENVSQQSKLSDFVRDFLTMKFRQIPPKAKVFQQFRSEYNFSETNHADKLPQLEILLQELKRYASYYNKLINQDSEPDKEICEHLKYINRLEITTAFPFLLEIYQDYSTNTINRAQFIEVLKLIQSFAWRRFLCGVPTNALNKLFMTLYQSVNKSDYLPSIETALLKKRGSQRFPNDTEVIENLKTKDFYSAQSKNRIYFFERLENHKRNIPFQIEGNEKVTTEHILPQNPSREWKTELGDALEPLKQKYLHTVANLTISGNNGELGNKSFTAKRDLPEFGYKQSGLWLNQYLAEIDRWTEGEILERLRILTERTLQIWKFPNVVVVSNESDDEINVFDVDNPTGKQITGFTFLETEYSKRYFSDVLQIVAQTLFETESERFFNTDLKDKLKLTTDKSILRQPMSVSPSYFIEGHYG